MNFKDFKEAVKAKLRDKSDMPDWYYKRLKICSECEFNSGNNEEISLKDKIRISHNFGKDSCLKCSCGIKDACSSEAKQCPDNQWFPIALNYTDDYKVFNLKKDTTNLSYVKDVKYYILNFGQIKKGTKVEGSVFFETGDNEISNFSTTSSCGCTTPTEIKEERGYIINIIYKHINRIGEINQDVKIRFTNHNNIPQIMLIKIKGKII